MNILKTDFSTRVGPSILTSATAEFWTFKWNKLSFPCVEINRPANLYPNSQGQLPQIGSLITITVESSINRLESQIIG